MKKLSDGQLYAPKTGGAVYAVVEGDTVTDPLTGATVEGVPAASLTRLKLNNALRGAIGEAMSQMDPAQPRPHPASCRRPRYPCQRQGRQSFPARWCAPKEQDGRDQGCVMEQARAVIMLKTDVSSRRSARRSRMSAARGNRDALTLLTRRPRRLAAGSPAADRQRDRGDRDQARRLGCGAEYLVRPVAGSVLLLAAIGLAITFGVMGVINMAHGEMVMLGAYTTYVVQQALASYAPGLSNLSLVFAVPAAFLFTGLVGIAIERGIIRWLYGRPLETLLATWGPVTDPAADHPHHLRPHQPPGGQSELDVRRLRCRRMSITYNRLWIIVFSLFTFLALLTLLKRSKLGLQMPRRHAEPPHGLLHGHPHADGRRHDLGLGSTGIAGMAG